VRALEAFVMETGRRLFGIFSIPFVAGLAGAQVSITQGAIMAAIFFVAGFLWTYAVRVVFSKIQRGKGWRSSKES